MGFIWPFRMMFDVGCGSSFGKRGLRITLGIGGRTILAPEIDFDGCWSLTCILLDVLLAWLAWWILALVV
jgi:hypothetical protein